MMVELTMLLYEGMPAGLGLLLRSVRMRMKNFLMNVLPFKIHNIGWRL